MLTVNWFILIVFLMGVLLGNRLIAVAAGLLLVAQMMNLHSLLGYFSDRALDLGLILLLIAVLAPIAHHPPEGSDIVQHLGSATTWLAVLGGAAATRLQGSGLGLLQNHPEVIAGLLVGTLVGVLFFGGIPVGPLTGAGLTAVLAFVIQQFF